jgi:hypothetical protein
VSEQYRTGQLQYVELRDLDRTSSIVSTVKYRRLRWTRHVPRMGKIRSTYIMLMVNLFENDSLGYMSKKMSRKQN